MWKKRDESVRKHDKMLIKKINRGILYLIHKAVYNVQKDSRLSQKAAVVLSHGFSTASSIADAANRFLGQ